MTFQPGAVLSAQSIGTKPENIEVPFYASRAPTSTDYLFPVGKEWVYIGNSIWKLLSLSSSASGTTGNWVQIAGSSGAIASIAGTTNQITATTASNATTLSVPSTFVAPGTIASTTTITAGTTLTATLGAITATNGNIVLGTAGNKIISSNVATTTAAGANSFGSVTLVAGTATVATTAVTANSLIFLSRMSVGATGANDLGILSVGTIVAGTSFVINAWTVTDATALQTDDVSSIAWFIVN